MITSFIAAYFGIKALKGVGKAAGKVTGYLILSIPIFLAIHFWYISVPILGAMAGGIGWYSHKSRKVKEAAEAAGLTEDDLDQITQQTTQTRAQYRKLKGKAIGGK